MYDPRIGRFFAEDPLVSDYAWNSPYAFSENRVLDAIELEGLESHIVIDKGKQSEIWATNDVANGRYGMETGQDILNSIYSRHNVHSDYPLVISTGKISEETPKWKLFTQTTYYLGLNVSFVERDWDTGDLHRVQYKLKIPFHTVNFLGIGDIPEFLGSELLLANALLAKKIKTQTRASSRAVVGLTSKRGADIVASTQSLKSLREGAVKQAWKDEKKMILATGQGTREWTIAEMKEIVKNGNIKGFAGHHINDVKYHPNLAGNPNNIEFLKTGNLKGGGAKKGSEHYLKHNTSSGKRIESSSGPLIDRTIPKSD